MKVTTCFLHWNPLSRFFLRSAWQEHELDEAAKLALTSLPAILAEHEQAEKIREAAQVVAKYAWKNSVGSRGRRCRDRSGVSEEYHNERMAAMDRLRAALAALAALEGK